MSKYRTTRLFALQVSDHDAHWGGNRRNRETNRLKRALQMLALLPAVAVFLMPSFKIGRLVYRAPEFAIPDSAKQGSVFTVPIESDFLTVQLQGHDLPEVKAKNPLYLAAVNTSSPIMDLVLTYKSPESHLSLKMFVPKFEHPQYSVYTKQIKVEHDEDAEALEDSALPKPVTKSASGKPLTPAEKLAAKMAPTTPEPKMFTRSDGVISASCWKEPALEEIQQFGVRQGRRPGPKLATLKAAGGGEVVQAGYINGPGSEKSVILYHGGGLFTRYHGVKDYRVRKGDHVSSGQTIAIIDAVGVGRKPAAVHWDLHLGETELNRENFLALSTQLCDSK